MEAVELQNLSKTYPGGKKAVKSVTLSLSPGEVFGFLGPNGAGKTTTVKLLNGMLTPTGGSCRVLGLDPLRESEKTHALSGVVTEHAQMYDHLTGLENLLFFASLYGLSESEGKRKANQLLEELELAEAAGQKLSSYSTGMRQRLSFARALIHNPRVLFLDEPTSGLDPESALNVNRMIQTLAREEQLTIFLCTHQLRYAQEICTRYGLIEEGRLLASGSLEDLRQSIHAGVRLKLCADLIPEGLALTRTAEKTYEADLPSEDKIPGIVRRIVEAGGNIYRVEAQKPSLEDIYFALTAGGKENSL